MDEREDRATLPPLKIAQVSPYDFPYPGGVTEHIAHLAEQLRRAGHEVHVIAPSSADPKSLEQLPFLHRIGHVVPIPYNGSVARIELSLGGYLQVKRLLRAERFDIVHLHEPLVPALPLTVLRHSQAVNIGTFHAYRKSNIALYYARPILQPFVAKLHARIAVSPAARDFIAEYFPGEYRVVPNGIDYERFAGPVEPLPQYQDGKLTVLFVGRLEKRKGVKHLLRAWGDVRRQVPQARLVIVGAGRPLESYRAFAAAQGWPEVEFVGFVPAADLPRYYRTAHVFCAPSTGQESFGIVLLEAMAAGTPIVASDIPGYRDVVAQGVTGLLVPPRDERALAAALVRLLDDRDLRARLGAAGRVTAREYAWPKVAARVLAVYYETLAGRAALAPGGRRFDRVRRVASELASFIVPRL